MNDNNLNNNFQWGNHQPDARRRNIGLMGWNRVIPPPQQQHQQQPQQPQPQQIFRQDQQQVLQEMQRAELLRHERAQAGGNRFVRQRQPIPQFVARPIIDNHQGQMGHQEFANQMNNREELPNHRAPLVNMLNLPPNRAFHQNVIQQNLNRRHRVPRNPRREQRNTENDDSSRRRGEPDHREEECWNRINRKMKKQAESFSSSSPISLSDFLEGGLNIHIPNDAEVCAMLRSDEQRELIMDIRNMLAQSGACGSDLRRALEKIDMHLRNNEIEYRMIEETTQQLVNTSNSLQCELNNLDELLARIHTLSI